jgi:ubiquinone/menaquinone biosynthesis C-methylase UbiE
MRKCLLLIFLLPIATAFAATPQAYKYLDKLVAPYVPTNQPTLEAMLRIANVGPGDFVIDLGSGDGRILITAAKNHGARGFGVDLDPQLVRESVDNAKIAGVSGRVQFYQRDLLETRIGEATVVTLYLLPDINLKLRSRMLKELKPGTRVVAHDFDMGEWKPDIRASVRGTGSQIFLWVVPARVAGKWDMRVESAGGKPYAIELNQIFQEIEGMASRAGRPFYLRDARLDGDRITFVLIDNDDYTLQWRFEGRISGNAIEGTMRGEAKAPRNQHKWRATRAAP